MGQGVFCPLSKICRCTGQNSGGFPDRLGWLFNQAGGRPGHKKIPLKRNGFKGICYGAARQIRTADLILTKDALYQLSYSSKWRPGSGSNRRPPA